MALLDSEVESLRFHLGFGNISDAGYPYTPDGMREIFSQVISENLTGSAETTATTTTVANALVTVTPVSMTGIVAQARLVIDVGPDVEVITVRSTASTTFTARFARAHTGTYVVAAYSGHARLRLLLGRADTAFENLTDSAIGDTAGLKQIDKGDVEWFDGFHVLRDRKAHYDAIVNEISVLVQVPRRTPSGGNGAQMMVY